MMDGEAVFKDGFIGVPVLNSLRERIGAIRQGPGELPVVEYDPGMADLNMQEMKKMIEEYDQGLQRYFLFTGMKVNAVPFGTMTLFTDDDADTPVVIEAKE